MRSSRWLSSLGLRDSGDPPLTPSVLPPRSNIYPFHSGEQLPPMPNYTQPFRTGEPAPSLPPRPPLPPRDRVSSGPYTPQWAPSAGSVPPPLPPRETRPDLSARFGDLSVGSSRDSGPSSTVSTSTSSRDGPVPPTPNLSDPFSDLHPTPLPPPISRRPVPNTSSSSIPPTSEEARSSGHQPPREPNQSTSNSYMPPYIESEPAEMNESQRHLEPSPQPPRDFVISGPPPYPPIRECPFIYPCYYSTRWYELQGLEQMRICSKCFDEHIRPTQFANKFNFIDEPEGTPRTCRFNTTRMLQIWSQGVSENSFFGIQDFMTRRAQIPQCVGKRGSNGSAGIKWFAPRTGDIPGFVACEACYEDIILATNFANNFQPSHYQGADQVWFCDLSIPFLARALKDYAKTNAWQEFATAAAYRMALPDCTGSTKVMAFSRKWVRPRSRIDGLVICETCYYDCAACSPLGMEFEYSSLGREERYNMWNCDMSLVQMKAAWADAFEKNNFQIWWNAARSIMSHPQCANGEIKDGLWYVLAQDSPGFQICVPCYAGLIYPFGLGHMFKQIKYPPGAVVNCSFSAKDPRAETYLRKYVETFNKSRPEILTSYIIKYAFFAPCPRTTLVTNGRWFGTRDFVACQGCYEEVIKETRLEPQLQFRGSQIQGDLICCVYSPRMRALWSRACAEDNLELFSAASRHRTQVYLQTMPEINNIMAVMRMRMQQKGTMLLASTGLMGAGAIASAARAPGYHHHYGNSSIGYGYDNMASAEGAMMAQKANGIHPVGAGEYMRVAQLEAIWKEVE